MFEAGKSARNTDPSFARRIAWHEDALLDGRAGMDDLRRLEYDLDTHKRFFDSHYYERGRRVTKYTAIASATLLVSSAIAGF